MSTAFSKYLIFFLPLAMLVTISGCTLLIKQESEEPVARVFDKYLYASDFSDMIPQGTSVADSANIASNYIDDWVRNQLMLHRAELALSEDQKNVEKKIEEYRTSLLIYTYRQKLLQQKLDTVVSDQEIQEYYDENINNFILSDVVVKAIFVKVPLSAPDIGNVRSWMRSGSMDELDKLEKYSINYAEKFDIFDNDWVYFARIMEQVPLEISQPDRYLRYNKNIETTDSQFHYFIHFSEFKTEGDYTPLSLIRNEIKSILLNKRKIQFYNNLEKQVYNEGANRNQFEIY